MSFEKIYLLDKIISSYSVGGETVFWFCISQDSRLYQKPGLYPGHRCVNFLLFKFSSSTTLWIFSMVEYFLRKSNWYWEINCFSSMIELNLVNISRSSNFESACSNDIGLYQAVRWTGIWFLYQITWTNFHRIGKDLILRIALEMSFNS